MSTWNGVARSNYFKVKDEAAFREAVEAHELRVLEGKDDVTKGMFGLLSTDSDTGDWNLRDEEGEEIPVWELVSPHLQDGQIAVFMSAGSEKARYVTGEAVAITNEGNNCWLSLNDIYEKAAKFFGIPHHTITRAEY